MVILNVLGMLMAAFYLIMFLIMLVDEDEIGAKVMIGFNLILGTFMFIVFMLNAMK